MSEFIDIESISNGMEKKVRQNLKYKTGKFVWKVQFNTALNPQTVNNINLYVTTLNQTPLKTAIRYDVLTNTIEIEPLEAYAQNESYVLNVTTNVESKGGKKLKSPVQIQFRL